MIPPFDRESLKERLAAGERFVYRFFYGHTPREDGRVTGAIFSQFFPCVFTVDDETYHWAEQWMMASKARLFEDRDTLSAILRAQTPLECKALGRRVADYDETRWADARFDLVTRGNLAKFTQNATFADYLRATGDEILVEAAPRDTVWGIGLGREDPKAADPFAWPGHNLLGFALVRTRAILCGVCPPV